MDRLAFASISAMRTAMSRQATIAHNLANANTPGFRGDMAAASTLWEQGKGFGSRALSSEETVSADMTQGTVSHTGKPLDVALNGDAMLAVQASDGDEAYTRRGDLQVTDAGLLTTGDGSPVLGDGGPITIPPNAQVTISATGVVSVVPEGGGPKDVQQVDTLKLVGTAGSKVVKGLDGLFRVAGGGALPSSPDARLTPGAIEESNVSASDALIQMIEAGRSWETQVKMLSSAKDMDTDATKLMALPD